ncbi:hypothetical protein BXZ70DRAFT_1006727 [Cristinia sonorae]|uniref:Uncharacterized protein n=1 Tax=Cristinia sonorae TaxID=1940300 RepID=A0A8K0XRP9_9AGAR|nr:hypothetical protein BXZ70DRAFT_1006727 [Cristinia sonorae]
MSGAIPQLPNPLTPLAWLPPNIAADYQNVQLILVAILGAWVWDAFMALPQEFRLLYKHRVRLPDAVYVLARLSCGLFIALTTIFSTAPIRHCTSVAKAQGWAVAIQFPMNSLLFLFRIQAVFYGERLVIVIFTLLWLAVAATSVLAPFCFSGVPIGDTAYCIDTRLKDVGSAGIVTAAVDDTLVFLAITTKLVMVHPSSTTSWSQRWKLVFIGEGMGRISRVVFRTGQLYYLVTVGFSIASAVAILSHVVPDPYANVSITLNAFMTNVMATRVYRQLKLGLMDDYHAATNPSDQFSTIVFRARQTGHSNASTQATRYNVTVDPVHTGDVELNDVRAKTSSQGPQMSTAYRKPKALVNASGAILRPQAPQASDHNERMALAV